MPAIDALPSTPVETRPGGQLPASSENSAATDTHASDAFIAALLAQNAALPATSEAPSATTAAVGTTMGGQDLPAVRPRIAAQTGPQRALASALVSGAAQQALSPTVVTADDEKDFACAIANLQDQVTGATAGAQGPPGATDTTPSASASLLFAEVTSNGAVNSVRVDNALDGLAALHGARAQEPVTSSPAYAAKPAPLPMDQPALFAERLNQHISVMLGEGVQSAQIAVSPAELGPVEVRVTMIGDEAKVQMVASHAATREALNDAMPRLRASFAEAGLSLAQAGVFAQMPERQQAQPAFDGGPAHNDTDFEQTPLASITPARVLRIGLIDAFV